MHAEFIIIFKSALFFITTQHHLLPVGPPSPQPSRLRNQPGYAGPASSLAVTWLYPGGRRAHKTVLKLRPYFPQGPSTPPPPRIVAPSAASAVIRSHAEGHSLKQSLGTHPAVRASGSFPAAGVRVRGVLCVLCVCALVCLRACARRLEQVPAHLPGVRTWAVSTFSPPRVRAAASAGSGEDNLQGLPRLRLALPWTQGSGVCRPHPAPAGPALVRNTAQPARRLREKPGHCRARTSGPHGGWGGRKGLSGVPGCLVVLTLESVGPESHCWVRTRAPPLSYSRSLAGSPKPLSLSFPICETGTVTASAELSAERVTGPLDVQGLVAAPSTGGSYARVSSADT